MKTIEIIVRDDKYLNTVSYTQDFDSDVAWTEILEIVDADETLIGLLNAAGYNIPKEQDE